MNKHGENESSSLTHIVQKALHRIAGIRFQWESYYFVWNSCIPKVPIFMLSSSIVNPVDSGLISDCDPQEGFTCLRKKHQSGSRSNFVSPFWSHARQHDPAGRNVISQLIGSSLPVGVGLTSGIGFFSYDNLPLSINTIKQLLRLWLSYAYYPYVANVRLVSDHVDSATAAFRLLLDYH